MAFKKSVSGMSLNVRIALYLAFIWLVSSHYVVERLVLLQRILCQNLCYLWPVTSNQQIRGIIEYCAFVRNPNDQLLMLLNGALLCIIHMLLVK